MTSSLRPESIEWSIEDGLLAVIPCLCFGSSLPTPVVSKVDRPHTGTLRKIHNLLTGEDGGGAKSYDGEKAWSSINRSLLSCRPCAMLVWAVEPPRLPFLWLVSVSWLFQISRASSYHNFTVREFWQIWQLGQLPTLSLYRPEPTLSFGVYFLNGSKQACLGIWAKPNFKNEEHRPSALSFSISE